MVGLAWWQRSREAVEVEEILWREAKDHIAILEEIETGLIRLEGDLPLILVARATRRLCDRREAPRARKSLNGTRDANRLVLATGERAFAPNHDVVTIFIFSVLEAHCDYWATRLLARRSVPTEG